jgi:hypothetical protein
MNQVFQKLPEFSPEKIITKELMGLTFNQRIYFLEKTINRIYYQLNVFSFIEIDLFKGASTKRSLYLDVQVSPNRLLRYSKDLKTDSLDLLRFSIFSLLANHFYLPYPKGNLFSRKITEEQRKLTEDRILHNLCLIPIQPEAGTLSLFP